MSNQYLVVRLLTKGSFYSADTYSLGKVELRRAKMDTPEETAAIEGSRTEFGETDEQHVLSMRISTVLSADTAESAQVDAEEVFEEALDILQMLDTAVYNFRIYQAGYCRNLISGQIEYRRKLKQEPLQQTSLRMPTSEYGSVDFSQMVATKKTPLIKQFLRHAHWMRKTKNETNIQMRILFRWFSIEAIWKESESVDVVPMILWCLGFPTRDGLNEISLMLRMQLFAIPDYGTSKADYQEQYDKIRDFRNNSVHNGFRWQDISKSNLHDFDHLTFVACAHVRRFVTEGIRNSFATIDELKANMPKLFDIPNRVSMIMDTLHGLRNPSLFRLAHAH